MTEQTHSSPPHAVVTEAAVQSLVEIAWMARRTASTGEREHAQDFNEAQWLLSRLAVRHGLRLGHPDQTANRDYAAQGGMGEMPSRYADGSPTDFSPTTERTATLSSLSEPESVQWMVGVIHPLAHAYADGRATYATAMFNDATRTLRNAGCDLSPTEAQYGTVWVSDGMGDGYAGLSIEERAERDRA